MQEVKGAEIGSSFARERELRAFSEQQLVRDLGPLITAYDLSESYEVINRLMRHLEQKGDRLTDIYIFLYDPRRRYDVEYEQEMMIITLRLENMKNCTHCAADNRCWALEYVNVKEDPELVCAQEVFKKLDLTGLQVGAIDLVGVDRKSKIVYRNQRALGYFNAFQSGYYGVDETYEPDESEGIRRERFPPGTRAVNRTSARFIKRYRGPTIAYPVPQI